MFRRLANRVSDAVNSATSSNATDSSSDARVSELAAMGFREAEARQALRQANGDMTQATEWLLINGSPVGITANPIAISETSTEDAELQGAIQASLAIEKKKPRHQSAASKHAGQAASARLSQPTTKKTLATTHPKVQMPKRLSQHDQEDVILRCANRVAPHSLSVDTLLRSLKTIQGNPSNRKYHTVDTSSAGFQRSLKAPGVLDFLKAVNFHPEYQNNKKLTMSHYDAAAFYLGISALEQIQNTNNEYTKDKALRIFQSELTTALKESSEQELKARNQFLSLLPTEPKKGGSQITIEYGVILNHANNTEVTKILRNFDHDDTLGDVLNWLGGQSSVLKQKLESGDWKLVDRNRQGKESTYGFHELDLQDLQHRSLQYAGCWPSGRLAVVPKLELWF
mmetsp:Transcript_22537/g.55852  ORF Transcript_22537/g.55852 Transcript_22537/m.55852 type:complete len:398 (+) Transcript_22537:98-1291(+)